MRFQLVRSGRTFPAWRSGVQHRYLLARALIARILSDALEVSELRQPLLKESR